MKILGRARFEKRLRAIPSAVRAEVARALKASADDINAVQRRFAPVDDGDLVGSIRNHVEANGLRAVIEAGGPATTRPVREGADASYDYALGQEFGTREMPAQPFFYPGWRLGKKRAKSRITRAMNRGIKKAVAG